MSRRLTSLFVGILVLATGAGYCQSSSDRQNADSFLLFDQIIGVENTAIFNGMEYIETHRIVNNKHKFFQSFDFVKGTVIYDGQPFFNVSLKYNIFEDLVLVRLDNQRGKNIIQLYRSRVDGFSIGGHQFVNIKNEDPEVTGIHEVILENPQFRVLKKYVLKEKTRLDKKLLYHEFETDDPLYFFEYNGQIQEVSLKNLINTFPDDKSMIREQYRFHKKNLKSNSDIFMQRLFTELSKKGITE